MQSSLVLTMIAGSWMASVWASSETHDENVPDGNDISFLQASLDFQHRVAEASSVYQTTQMQESEKTTAALGGDTCVDDPEFGFDASSAANGENPPKTGSYTCGILLRIKETCPAGTINDNCGIATADERVFFCEHPLVNAQCCVACEGVSAPPTTAPTAAPTAAPTSEADLQIRWAGRCLEVGGGNTANGANVNMWDCGDGNSNQQWQLPSGTGLIRWNAHPNKCMEVGGGNTANGANVNMWDCNEGHANQMWQVPSNGAGSIRWNAHPNKCIEVGGGNTDNGANVNMWDCVDGNTNQQWQVPSGA